MTVSPIFRRFSKKCTKPLCPPLTHFIVRSFSIGVGDLSHLPPLYFGKEKGCIRMEFFMVVSAVTPAKAGVQRINWFSSYVDKTPGFRLSLE
jgi:hypothetical protein